MTFEEVADRLRTGAPSAGTAVLDDVLSAIKAAFLANEDLDDHRMAISAAIGVTADAQLQRELMAVRDEFDARSIRALIAEVERTQSQSAEEGWTCWARLMAEAVARSRYRQAYALCEHPFTFTAAQQAQRDELGRAVRCMLQSRWDEVDDTFPFLAEQPSVPPSTRARLIALQSQVEHWRFVETKRAASLVAEAERIAPDDAMVLATAGELASDQGQEERAIRYFERAIAAGGTEVGGFVGMGDRFERDERPTEAESWFRRAIAHSPGDASGYDSLVRLLLRGDGSRKKGPELQVLIDRRNAVEPDTEFDAAIQLGEDCRKACKEKELTPDDRRFYLAESRRWFERARFLDASNPLPYAWLAELSRDEDDILTAESWARQAIEVAPECPSGYLFLGPHYMSQARWAEAARIFERFPARPHRWKLYAIATLGTVQAEQGEFDRARLTMIGALREEVTTDREQVFAATALENLADDHSQKRNDVAAATRIYDELLAIQGESYKARYHYLLGNLHAKTKQFEPALDHYRQAIAAAPSDESFHRALIDALVADGRFDDARQAIDAAFPGDSGAGRRRREHASVANSEGNRAFESERYKEAAELYARACELDKTTPVFRSNLALACENRTDAGSRAEHLALAQRWYGEAQQLAGDQRYVERIERLRRRASLATVYGERALEWVALATPIVVEVADDLLPFVTDESRTALSPGLNREIEAMRATVASELGITLSGINFRSAPELTGGTCIVQIHEVPVASTQVSVARRFFPGSHEQLEACGVPGAPTEDPVSLERGFWVERGDWAKVESREPGLWSTARYLVRQIEAVVRINAEQFVGHQEVAAMLGRTPESAIPAITTPEARSALANVCRALAAEGVPLLPFGEICRTFELWHRSGIRPHEIVERLRLLPGIRDKLPGRDRRTYVRMSERFESELRRALARNGDATVLVLTPERCQAVLSGLRGSLETAHQQDLALVVADPILRPFVRRLVEIEFANVCVLSMAEAREDREVIGDRADLEPSMDLPTRDSRSPLAGLDATLEADATPDSAARAEPVVSVTVASGMLDEISAADELRLDELLMRMREGLFQELGLMVPLVRVAEDPGLDECAFRVGIGDQPVEQVQGLARDEGFVNDSVERLRLLNLHGREAINPVTGNPGTILTLDGKGISICKEAGLPLFGPLGYLVLHLGARLRRHADALHTVEATHHLLDSVSLTSPVLVELALQRYGLATLWRVCRHLLAEEISVRNMRGILEGLLGIDGSSDVDLERFIAFTSNAEPVCFDPYGRALEQIPASMLADQVRTCLRAYISHKYTRGSSTLAVYLLDQEIEHRLRQPAGPAATQADASRLVAAVQAQLPAVSTNPRWVLLTNLDVRSKARAMLREAFPSLAVLSYQELSPWLNISPLGRISWEDGVSSSAVL